VSHLTSIFCLTRFEDVILPGSTYMPPIDEVGWAVRDSPTATQPHTSSNSRLVCPIERDWTEATLILTNPASTAFPTR
jgi:hypothetical protein